MFTVWSTNVDWDEFPVVSSYENVDVRHLQVLTSTALWPEGEDSLRKALRDDLIIVSLNGHSPRETVRGLVEMAGEKEWRRRKAKVVLRTQDSHHQLQDELAIIDDIDLIAIAHSSYLEYFPPHKVLHVPCSLYYTRSMAKEWLRQIPIAKDTDVIFPFQLYRGEPRNALAYEILRNLNTRGIVARFGFFRYFRNQEAPPLLWEELARGRVILNLPLRDDFNIRNLEASLFPSLHLTPRLPDHRLVTMDWSNTRFVEPNASKITSVIEEILESYQEIDFSRRTRESVLQHHTANDRIYQIIDAVLGTTLQRQSKVFDVVSAPSKKQPIVNLYDEASLLKNSPTLLRPVAPNSLYRPSIAIRLKATLLLFRLIPSRIVKMLARAGGPIVRTKAEEN